MSCQNSKNIYILAMLIRALFLLLFSLIVVSCGNSPMTGSNHQSNMEKLDKYMANVETHIDNIKKSKEECEDKQRAAGPDGVVGDPINVTEIMNRVRGVGGNTVAVSDTNNALWDGSLQVLNNYSLKITDFDGGYIETNWINNSDLPSQRCLIKSHITSKELISTGINVKIICEKLINNEWYLSDENFTEDEKRLTLKILETAQTLANT